MLRRILLVLAISAVLPLPAHAAWFSGGEDLQKMLAEPDVIIDGYELSKDDLNAFYAARDYRPAWDFSADHGQAFAASLTSIERLIDYHGLQRDDYALEDMQKLAAAADDADNRAKLELLTADTFLRLARDLHGDKIDLDNLYPGWNFHREDMDIPATLAAAVAANGLHEYFESLPPQNPAYMQLAQALQIYRDIAAKDGWQPIDKGPTLRPGNHSPRVAQLRARLAAEGYMPAAALEPGNLFGNDLKVAVEAYQMRNGLEIDGDVGPKALEALNTPVAFRLDQIMANMERWRHMPNDFPPQRYTLVNIPDASVVIIEDGKEIYKGIVIVGRVDRKTPFIQSEIRSMIINPFWHVPSKIARKDILPKLKQDPHYLEKLGIVIKGSEDDPYGENIDWQSIQERQFDFKLRQEPGELNSLGRLKFDFANDFAVYMHGTPHQELFKKNERALSSGCVRLHDPAQVAEIFLSGNKDPWDAQRISDAIASGKNHWVAIAKPMPLYIVYWTVFADEGGQINFRTDVYDYDSFLMKNMKSEIASEPAKTP